MAKRATRLLCAFAVCVMLSAMAPLVRVSLPSWTARAASAPVWINADTQVYEQPSMSARAVGVGRGLSVTLTAWRDGWAQVSYMGRTGYLPLKFVTLQNPIPGYLAVSAEIFRNPGVGSLGVAPAGTAVFVDGVDGSYAHIASAAGGATGYVLISALTRTAPGSGGMAAPDYLTSVPEALRSNASSASQSRVEYVIYVAQNLAGAPYAETADPPKTFDCAKFCWYCYGKARGELKGSSYSQGYDDRFPMIASMADLKRGDLVCFDTIDDDDQCDHVGIYLGNGCFIHACAEAKKVVVSSMVSGYYNRTFSWGRRIFDS